MGQGLVKIGLAAEYLGVSRQTLLKWERSGELVPARRSRGGTRYYSVSELMCLAGIEGGAVGIEDRIEK